MLSKGVVMVNLLGSCPGDISSNLILYNNNTNEVNLKKFTLIKIKNVIFIKSFRGLRLKQGLPVRGQRTHPYPKTSRKRK